jgi:hypothetical protein
MCWHKSDDWDAKDYALKAEGCAASLFQTIGITQAHGLESAPKVEFWALSGRAWFPEAFYCFWRLRSEDVVHFSLAVPEPSSAWASFSTLFALGGAAPQTPLQ